MRPGPPHVLGLFRICFSSYLLIEAATYLPHVSMMFSSAGLAIPMQTGLAFLAPPAPAVAWLVALGYIVALFFLLIGYRMRTALLVLILSFLYYWQLSFHAFPSSYHRLSFFMLLVLMLGGADRTFSIRMKRTHGSWLAWEPISILPQRLLAVQITATYAVVGLQKWWLPLWRDGDVLFYSFIGRWGTPLARRIVLLGLPPVLYDALTLLTKLFETAMPVGLWIPRIRRYFFAAGCIFHVAIAALLGIWWFLVLIPAYIVFLEPEKVLRYLQKHLSISSLPAK